MKTSRMLVLLGAALLALTTARCNCGTETAPSAPGTFTATGSMGSIRGGHTATLLPSGKVLIAGGSSKSDLSGLLLSAELYDPATGKFTYGGSLGSGRASPNATLLPSGKVLIAGGYAQGEYTDHILLSAELYDPARETFTPTGSGAAGGGGSTATLLPSGKVLIAGGYTEAYLVRSTAIAIAALYDPNTGTFTGTGSLVTARSGHTATRILSGRVLIVGGVGEGLSSFLASAELYTP